MPADSAARTLNPADVRRAAMDLLARREHGTEELSKKLSRRFRWARETVSISDIAAIIDEQIERLVGEGLVSDDRYAASLVRQLIIRGLGPRRLDQELRLKGVREHWEKCADSASLSVDWFDRASEVYQKKFGGRPWPAERDLLQRERAKRARFMQYRGFEPDHFMHLLDVRGGVDSDL